MFKNQLNQAYFVLKFRGKQGAVRGDMSSGCGVEEGESERPGAERTVVCDSQQTVVNNEGKEDIFCIHKYFSLDFYLKIKEKPWICKH